MFSGRGCIRCRTTVSGHSPWKGVQETLFLLRFDSGNVKKHKTTACFRKESGWKHCFFFQTRSFGRKNRKQFVPTTPFGQKNDVFSFMPVCLEAKTGNNGYNIFRNKGQTNRNSRMPLFEGLPSTFALRKENFGVRRHTLTNFLRISSVCERVLLYLCRIKKMHVCNLIIN